MEPFLAVAAVMLEVLRFTFEVITCFVSTTCDE